MAMAGSAIGLGNIWRFPYMVGQYGGAAFIIIYILCSFLLALPIFLSETIIGRRSRCNTVGAMEKLAPGTAWKWLRLLTVVSPVVILSYYSVVGGWSVEYLFKSLSFEFTNTEAESIQSLFGRFISSTWEPLITHTLFMLMVAGIILGGVKSGIERFTKITMPALFVLIVVMLIFSVSLPGAGAGVSYMLKPDFSKLTMSAVAAAMGQSFFSLSLGVGTILTYSSYMREDENILSAGGWTAFFDTLFALIAGFAIMPAVFAAGIEPAAGPSLVFETLPVIFSRMGVVLPVVFFLAILIAALSSSISMLEVVVAWLVDQKGMRRSHAVLAVFGAAAILGCVCAAAPRVFSTCDFISSNVLMMIGALVFALIVGWKMPRAKVLEYVHFRFVYWLIRYAAPVMIVAIAVTNLL